MQRVDYVPLSGPIFGAKKQKCPVTTQQQMKRLNHYLQNSRNRLSRYRAICCRPEVDGDAVQVKRKGLPRAMWRYMLKMLALVLSKIFQKDHFVTVKSVTAGMA